MGFRIYDHEKPTIWENIFCFSNHRTSKSKDVFFSHTWRTKGSQKILALLFQFGWHFALLLWTLVAVVTFALVATGVLVSPFEVEISVLSFSKEIAYFPWITCATACSFIVSYMILPYVLVLSRPTTCFLDVVCIHQRLVLFNQR